MGLVVDADAISKLAHWRLLEELPELTGMSWSETCTLPSLRHRAQRAVAMPDGRLFRHSEAAQATVRAIASMQIFPDIAATHLSTFQEVPEIDVGEALLLALLAQRKQDFLLTGDKRALRALSRLSTCLRSPFGGRIILLEEVVLQALKLHGIDWLRERICPYRDLDKAISISLGSNCDASAEAVRDGLRSYIGEVHALCIPPLLR